MWTSVSIDADGNVTVTCDSDGDQGEGYSTDCLKDTADRAGHEAVAVWFTMRKQMLKEQAERDKEQTDRNQPVEPE